MKKHGTSHVGDRANRAFRNTVLMMCVGPTVTNLLLVFADVTNKLVGFESAAVGEVICNSNAMSHCMLFEGLFGTNCFHSGESKLMFNMNVATGMVYEQTTTDILVGCDLAIGIVSTTFKA